MDNDEREPLGRRHPLLQRLRALRRDGNLRRSESVFVAEGVHLARETLASELEIEQVLLAPRVARSSKGAGLLEALRRRGLNCRHTTDELIDSVQDARSPQPIVLIVKRPTWTAAQLCGEAKPLIAVACGLQDPGNLGTLIRTAHAAGGSGCLLHGPSADPFHPRTVRASAGSILHLPVLADADGQLLAELAQRGVEIVATAADGTTEYHEFDFTVASAVLFGSEGDGLSPELLGLADRVVRIPLRSGVESLSVSSAAAVVLFEAARQRAAGGSGVRASPDDP